LRIYRLFRLFGHTVETRFPFALWLQEGTAPIDLLFELHPDLALPALWKSLDSIYTSPFRSRNGEPVVILYRQGDQEVFRFSRVGDFLLRGEVIDGYLLGSQLQQAELHFLGPVMSYWLEHRGLPTLHASAVAVDSRAVAFVSRHGGGKSGLAAALTRAGASLLTDDLLALQERNACWEVMPSYPAIRMWPDEATHFVGSCYDLPRVQQDSEKRNVAVGGSGFGSFYGASSLLTCIYLAMRVEGADAVEIQPVSRSEALIELVRHSFSPRLMEAAGLQPARLDRLARLVRSVPVRRLVYPSGFDRLAEVAGHILEQTF
jgi:hypothetical protein